MTEASVPDIDSGEAPVPPATGNTAVDDALASLVDLDSAPVDAHHDRLARAHEALQAALDKGSGSQDPADLG
jgi:hypothetical protein